MGLNGNRCGFESKRIGINSFDSVIYRNSTDSGIWYGLELLVMECYGNEWPWRDSYEFDHKNREMCVFANKRVAPRYSSVVQNRMKHDHSLLR